MGIILIGSLFESRKSFLIVCDRVRQDLARDFATESGVVSARDLARTTGANLRGDFLKAKASTEGEGQTVPIIGTDRRCGRDYSSYTPQGGLALPDLEHAKTAVLNSLTSASRSSELP